MVGPKLNRRVSHRGVEAFGSLALITTLCSWRSFSRSSVANAGRWVWNFVELVPLESFTAFLVTPLIASPVLVMLLTLSAETWSRNELYVMVTVGDWIAEVSRLLIRMLAANRTAKMIQKRAVRIGAETPGRFGAGGRGGGF